MIQPWKSLEIYRLVAIVLKQDVDIPEQIFKIAGGVARYEEQLRILWNEFKKNPTEENARKLAEFMKKISEKSWYEFLLDILGIDELPERHQDLLRNKLDEHHNYIQNSLLPDLIKEISKGTAAFDHFDYRLIFLYSGALWSFGFLATVMFDGLELRDLADIFMFTGPNDENTCIGDRGCQQHVGKLYTVAQILAQSIIPGTFKCLTSCRHILIPVLNTFKGGDNSGNWNHAGRPGKRGGSAPNMNLIFSNLVTELNVQEDISLEIVDKIINPEVAGEIHAEYKPKEKKILVTPIQGKSNPNAIGANYYTTKNLGFKALIAHELAHVKDKGFNKVISSNPKLVKIYFDQKDAVVEGNYTRVISKYSLSSPTEFYAEAIAVYAVNPSVLKKKDPELFEFVEETL